MGAVAARSAYLITFACYGSRVPGEAGAVDRRHNLFGSRLPEENQADAEAARGRMQQPPYLLDTESRAVVLGAIREVCSHRGWVLLAAHVRTNHVHVVVDADQSPERVLNDFKAYASRALNLGAQGSGNRIRWARHGSTRYLWSKESVSAAVSYVVGGQGEPMEVFEAGWG